MLLCFGYTPATRRMKVTKLIVWSIAGTVAFLHGAAVFTWASAQEFRDWNFYEHATGAEWAYYHTLYVPAILYHLMAGAVLVLISVALTRKS